MNFFLKLVFAGGIAGSLAATPHEGSRSTPPGANIVHTDSIMTEAESNSASNSDLSPLVNSGLSYEIKNPYTESADKPFTIQTGNSHRVAAPLATKVTCGGRTWEHDELLGRTQDNQPVRVRIQDNRIYLNWNGRIADNIWILFSLKENTFPDNPTNGSMIDKCVNPVDPSTAPSNLLGRTNDGQITCNGKVMTNGDLLGTYVGDGKETYQYTKYVDGMLRVMIKQGANDDRTTNYNMSLLNFTIQGANGSYMSTKWKNVLTTQMVDGCFWPIVPKPATPVSDNNNCASGPTLKSVTNISQTGLQFSFDGTNIGTVKWRIKLNNADVKSGTTGDLNGSKLVSLTYASIAPGTYSLEIEGGSCTSAVTRQNFTVPEPVVVIPNCSNGPTLTAVTNISQTGLQFTFNGTGITTVKWRIKLNNADVKSGTTGDLNGSKLVSLTYASIAPGTYSLEIEGGSCTSVVTKQNFTVPEPVVVIPNCSNGPTLTAVTNISQTGLQFTFNGTGITTVKWRIKLNNADVKSGITADLNGSKLVSLNFSSIAPGTYSLEIEGGSCTSVVTKLNFTIQEPVVGTPNCQNGPSVTTVKNITPSSATIDFGGSNLHVFSWRILEGSEAVASGKTGTLSSNTTDLTFNYLKNGTYTFEIKAEDCIAPAVATKSFNVSATDTRTACSKGPTLQSVLSSNETALSFLFDGNNVFAIDWKIMKGNTVVRQNRVAPQDNHPVVQYGSLENGVYTFQIQGGNCKSTTTAATFGVNVALPIYISGFKGEVVEKGVELSWEVVSEEGGKEFEVLRYDDKMKNVDVIGKVSLTDQRTGVYRFMDESPLLGINYYQLKQIDLDGTFTRSKLISVNPGIIMGTVVAPNPAQDYVDIQFSSRTAGQSELVIYNLSGTTVSTSQIEISEGKNNHRINVKKLNGGSYFMKISHAGEVSKLRFMKID